MNNVTVLIIVAASVVICGICITVGLLFLSQSNNLLNHGSVELNKSISLEENLYKQYDGKIFTGAQTKDVVKEIQEQGIGTLIYKDSNRWTYSLDGITDKANSAYLDASANIKCVGVKNSSDSLLGFAFVVGKKKSSDNQYEYPENWKFDYEKSREPSVLLTAQVGNKQYQIFKALQNQRDSIKELSRLSSKNRKLREELDTATIKSIDSDDDRTNTTNKRIEEIYGEKTKEYIRYAKFYEIYNSCLDDWLNQNYYGILLYNHLDEGTKGDSENSTETDTSDDVGQTGFATQSPFSSGTESSGTKVENGKDNSANTDFTVDTQ